jgi:hypothetical protein
MLQSISNHQIAGVQFKIVLGNLVEGGLGNGNVWCLAFHQEMYGTVSVKNDDIIPFPQPIVQNLFFDIDMAQRILFFDAKEHQGMLPHPFLWGKYHELFTDDVKNKGRILTIFESKVILGKVKGLHSTNLMIFSEWMKRYKS